MTLRDAWRSADALQTATAIALAAVVAGSVLAIGAVHKSVLLVTGLGVAVALVLARRLSVLDGGGRLHGVTLVLLGLGAYCLLQSLAMPLGLLRQLAPGNADVWERALSPLGETVARGSISLDPGASRIEAFRCAIYAGVFHVAHTLARRRGGTLVVTIVFGSAVLLSLTQLAHGLVGATKVFGIYAPRFPVDARHLGPLLNGNNLAGYLNMGAIAGAGLLVSRRRSVSVWLLAVGVALIVAASFRAASRGGAVALPAGLLGLALVQLVRRRRGRSSRRDAWIAAGIVAAAVALGGVLVVLAGLDDVFAELGSVNIQKVQLQRAAIDMVGASPWLGIGRGAFETAFGPHRPPHVLHVVFTHPENFVLQGLTEWGVPVTAAAAAAIGFFLFPTRTGALRSVLGVACLMAVGAFLLQNLADLGTEIPGVAIACTALLAVLAGSARARAGDRGRPRAAILVPAAVLGASALVADPAIATVAEAREEARALVGDATPPTAAHADAAFSSLRQAMLAHPGDPYFPILGGALALRADRPALPWIQRALERGPLEGRAHLLLATYLEGRGARAQALLHLRLAAEHEPPLSPASARAAARLVTGREDIERVAPAGAAGVRLLEDLANVLTARGRVDLAALCDDLALERDPRAPKPRIRRVTRLLEALERSRRGEEPTPVDELTSTACADPDAGGCDSLLEEELGHLADLPGSSVSAQLRARWLRAEGRPADALVLLDTACQKPEGRSACLLSRLSLAAELSDAAAVDAAQRDFVADACARADTCAAAWERVADVRLARRELNAAVAAMSRATKEAPTEARWARLAEVATTAGAHAKAVEALEALARLRGRIDPDLARRLDAARAGAPAPR